MELINWITLALGIYGAIISSILGIREIRRENRKIAILFVHETWTGLYSIAITNIGHRPITLIDFHIDVPNNAVPRSLVMNGYEDEEQGWEFPVTLSDGQHVSIRIPRTISDAIEEQINAEEEIGIKVFDAEGNSYSVYKKISYDSKYGLYTKK